DLPLSFGVGRGPHRRHHRMAPSGRLLVSAYFKICGAVLGWTLGVVIPTYGRWPMLLYDPAARRWFFARASAALPIGYYGLLLYAAAFGALGTALGAVAARKVRRRDEPFWLGTAWVTTALIGAL